MAVSGSQFTRIGASISGVARKLAITAKTKAEISTVKKIRRLICNVNKLGMR